MGFASGSVSFSRFAVLGAAPATIDQDMLERLEANALRPPELGSVEDVEYGWSGGRHVLDAQFSFEHNVYAECLSFALRVDDNKPPSSLVRAYQAIEEQSVAEQNPSGFISKNQKREVKANVARQVEADRRSGKFRRSKLVPLLWDVGRQTVYSAARGASFEKLAEIFQRTFDLELAPLSSGTIALRSLEARGRRRDYEDFRPTRFAHGPEGEGQPAEYPWVAKGPEAKDFLGNEFLLWLWHESETGAQSLRAGGADVTVFIDRMLELDCAFGYSGRDLLRGDGPHRMPEARDALRTGKVPRRAGLLLDAAGQQYSFTLSAESLSLTAAKLPDVEQADSPRVLYEERIALLRDLCKAIDAMFEAFLKIRASAAWESKVSAMGKWAEKLTKVAA